jgi:hypothetical protein
VRQYLPSLNSVAGTDIEFIQPAARVHRQSGFICADELARRGDRLFDIAARDFHCLWDRLRRSSSVRLRAAKTQIAHAADQEDDEHDGEQDH